MGIAGVATNVGSNRGVGRWSVIEKEGTFHMICRNCVSRQPDYARFCEACGAQLQPAAPQPARTPHPVRRILIFCLVILGGALAVLVVKDLLTKDTPDRPRDATLLQDSYCFETGEALATAVEGIQAGNAERR